jgi:phenylalanyl-tRNA synthetase beta chain
MRVPLSWLKEFIPLTLSPDEIAQKLTMIGLEVDKVECIGEHLNKIVVVRILEAVKHPNADKLTVAKVTDGKVEYQIVCGAPNCRTGIKVPLALIGAVFKDGDTSFEIKKSKIRGVESEGMLCTEKELELSENHEGILEFPDSVTEGTFLSELYSDAIFEISLTPNLAHCMSVMGVARELAALLGRTVHLPQPDLKTTSPSIENLSVKVANEEDCPRYACCIIKDVQVSPSPEWLQRRLEQCGLRSINNVVDITNLVLLELGHPLHAFDLQQIQGGEIVVRKAAEGEAIRTLDGKERSLDPTMLVIADRQRPLAIAGVMGGANSEVGADTRHIVLESAYFAPAGIRKTSKLLGIQTEASKRFERGTDPNQVLVSLQRAAALIQEIAGGDIVPAVIDVKKEEFVEKTVVCRLSRINRILGLTLSEGVVETIFNSLQFSFQWDGVDSFNVRIPTYRSDIQAEIDLVEEVARLYGYHNIPRQGARFFSSAIPPAPVYLFEQEIRNALIGEGLQEFITCDLVGPSLLEIVHDGTTTSAESMIKVLNPTSIEQSILRISLLPGLLQVVKHNIDHHNNQIAGFEVGNIHFRLNEDFREQPVFAIILSGQARHPHWGGKPTECDFFDFKGMIENLLREFGVEGYTFKNIGLPTFHTGRQASLYIDSLEIGSFGEIHPAIQRRLDVSQRILFGEFNIRDLMQVAKSLNKVTPLSIYPSSERDWTITIQQKIPYQSLLEMIHAAHSPLLESVSLKDVYQNERLGEGFHNLTLNFVYRNPSRTIAQEEVEKEHQQLTSSIIKQLGVAIK